MNAPTHTHPALAATLTAALLLLGCKPAPSPNATTSEAAKPVAPQYPPRPTTPPPPFKVFHQDGSTFTLVTDTNATDEQIESLIWQLRDAAHTHSFAKLHIPQKTVDDRKPIAWFHIYRGTKCATEKYGTGPLPCGASYHAAGEFTYGGYKNREAEDGLLLHDENHQTELWNADIPYSSPQPGTQPEQRQLSTHPTS